MRRIQKLRIVTFFEKKFAAELDKNDLRWKMRS